MNLNELIDSLSENDSVQQVLDEISDALIVKTLTECRERWICYYENVKNGIKQNIYVMNDLEEDAFQISLRIQSIDMILDEFKFGHEAYDFEAVEWWDDKEGLS